MSFKSYYDLYYETLENKYKELQKILDDPDTTVTMKVEIIKQQIEIRKKQWSNQGDGGDLGRI